MSLALDATPLFVRGTSGSGAASAAISGFSTALINDILVCEVSFFSNVATAPAVTSITGGPGGWVNRSRQVVTCGTVYGGPCHLVKETWWAAASAVQTSISITLNFSNAGATTYYTGILYAVNGCQDLVHPWDRNASLPAAVSHTGTGATTTHTVSGISTSSLNTFLLASMDMTPPSGAGSPAVSTDTSFTSVANTNSISYLSSMIESITFGATQTGLSYSINDGNSLYDYIITVDALTDGVSYVGPSPSSQAVLIG